MAGQITWITQETGIFGRLEFDVTIKNNGSDLEEYYIELSNASTGRVMDKEPDTYLVNVSPGNNVTLTVSTVYPVETMRYGFKLYRCVCTSWTGCVWSCDDYPVDDTAVRTVFVEPPPPTVYYDCLSDPDLDENVCVPVSYVTQYVNNPNCCSGVCNPSWQCELPLNGYESDGCGNRRRNSNCDATVPAVKWKCSGAPGYTCSQDSSGAYNSQAACIAACYAGGPPPPVDKYYDCVSGKCTQVQRVTAYKNDPRCGGMCKPAEDDNLILYAGVLTVALGIGYYVYKKR